MENRTFLEDLKFGVGDGNLHYYLYNWKTPEISPDKVRERERERESERERERERERVRERERESERWMVLEPVNAVPVLFDTFYMYLIPLSVSVSPLSSPHSLA